MKKIESLIFYAAVVIGLTLFIPVLSPEAFGVRAQGGFGNSISGLVFGLNRQPIDDIPVELLNEYSQTIAHSRTNGSGRYIFGQLSPGRFSIRVMPYGTDYEEQTQTVEITNFTRSNGNGGVIRSGFSNEQIDFYLRIRKGSPTEVTGIIFAQDVPKTAKKLYEKAIADLAEKKEKEGLAGLKSAIEEFPEYYVALERLGTEYVRLKYFDAAQILLTLATKVNPRAYRSWYGLAYSLYSLNSPDKALPAIQKAVELYPTSVEALLLSGVLMRHHKRFDEAEKHLLKANELTKETNALVHWQLALLYGNDMKRYRDAAKELKLFLKTQPDAKNAENIKRLIEDFEKKATNG